MSKYDCQTCGLCCALPRNKWSSMDRYIFLDEGDETPEEHLVEMGGRKHVRFESGRCSALAGTPGERVSCTIYGKRPTTCRAFKVGAPLCVYLRRRARLPVCDDAERRSAGIGFAQLREEAQMPLDAVAAILRVEPERLARIEAGDEVLDDATMDRMERVFAFREAFSDMRKALEGKPHIDDVELAYDAEPARVPLRFGGELLAAEAVSR